MKPAVDVVVLGSICYDTIKTRYGERQNILGGSGIYAALAASKTARAGVLGIAGQDYRDSGSYGDLFVHANLFQQGVEIRPGNTFRWTAEYDASERAHSVDRQFKEMMGTPKIPEEYRGAEYLLLGNHEPDVQLEILHQFKGLKLSVADTMDTYIESNKEGVKRVAQEADVIIMNTQEAKMFTGMSNVASAGKEILDKYAPVAVIIKCGEHGAVMYAKNRTPFMCPSVPILDVVDPTGAGDSVAGGFIGLMRLYDRGYDSYEIMKKALAWGSACASHTIQDFGTAALQKADFDTVNERYFKILEMLKV